VSTRLRFAEEIWLQSHFLGVETICASRTWRLNFLKDLDCENEHSLEGASTFGTRIRDSESRCGG
jgi:hypothetical protein